MLDVQEDNPFLELSVRSLFIRFILISFALSIALAAVVSILHIKRDDTIITYTLYCFSFGLLCIFILQRCNKLQIQSKYLIGNLQTGYRWLPTFVLVIFLVLFSIGMSLLSFYLLFFISPSFAKSVFSATTNPSKSSAPIIAYSIEFISMVVVAPITEEFIFRGIILHRWTAKWGIRVGILASSILFGALHANFLGLSVFGIVMALLYIKSRTFIVPIFAHSLNNVAAFFIQTLPRVKNISITSFLLNYWQLGILLVSISSLLLARFIYKTWYKQQQLSLPYFTNAVE